MNIKEAMNVIHKVIDDFSNFYNFYGNEVDKELEEVFKAEAILSDYVEAKETARPEKYWAVCPDCGHELEYEHFQYESCDEDKVYFFANGTCISCGRNFDWCETFELVDIEFDEEIDEE